jgi:hypothetical protein
MRTCGQTTVERVTRTVPHTWAQESRRFEFYYHGNTALCKFAFLGSEPRNAHSRMLVHGIEDRLVASAPESSQWATSADPASMHASLK